MRLIFEGRTRNIFAQMFRTSNQNLPRVEHFEIRDTKGNLVDKKDHIQNCYKNFKLT